MLSNSKLTFVLFSLIVAILLSGCGLIQKDPGLSEPCQPGEICVTVTAEEVTGKELRLILYETVDEDWPHRFRSIPTPSWVITEYPPVPDKFPVRIRIPMTENLFAVSGDRLEGARFGLAIATGVASFMVVEPTDARGFSETTLIYEEGKAMDFGEIELELPSGEPCELNAFLPGCQSGKLFWEDHLLGEESFVPGAVYIEVSDVDGDGVEDIITVGEPHFEEPDLPLDVLKLGVYYMNQDLTVREVEIVDQWTEEDQAFYSPWGVRVIQHAGKPMIIVGTNIPGLLPLREGYGNIFGYQKQDGVWERSIVRENPDPYNENFNAMIVVPCDIDQDGDDDIALSGAFKSSSVGSWMENTGDQDQPWISHLLPMDPDTDPYIRGTLAYKCTDLNQDSYPEVIYNGMFDVANTDPPRYRGEIWLAINPGPDGFDDPWEMVVIDDDNWASADMWFHDFDDDGYLDLIANQIFSSTVTHYHHPGDNISDEWKDTVIISGLTSPSDMWLTDMDGDGLVDIVSADHTAHKGVWHKNPGDDITETWEPNAIFKGIRMPGDFAMADMDRDGDLDYVGTSMTFGQIFIVEQTDPASSLVVTIKLPADFDQPITKLVLLLTEKVPLKGIPKAVLANIDNGDIDEDGTPDVDQMIGSDNQLSLSFADTDKSGEFHAMAVIYVEGGGNFQPESGVDYAGYSDKILLGDGKVELEIELDLLE
jgi:hypothetical protein